MLFRSSYLSRNSNPRIVAFLIAHPELIHIAEFAMNANDDAVSWVIQNAIDRAIDYIFRNTTSTAAIRCQIKIAGKVQEWHSRLLSTAGSSTNDLLIEWFLSEIDKQYSQTSAFAQFFVPPELLSNPHPRAVDWLFAHITSVDVDHSHYLCQIGRAHV